jgi:tRNA uridine 5-carbamoylmethylation protein Kti12
MPMLIIFGGLPGTGKTAIAQQLARELGAVFAHRFDGAGHPRLRCRQQVS